MALRLHDYFRQMEMDYLAEMLEGKGSWEKDTEMFYKYLPILLIKGKVKLKYISTERSYRQNNTRFKLTVRAKPDDWDSPFEKTVTFELTDGTLRHEFYFETYYNAQFKGHMEWYLHDKELQESIKER